MVLPVSLLLCSNPRTMSGAWKARLSVVKNSSFERKSRVHPYPCVLKLTPVCRNTLMDATVCGWCQRKSMVHSYSRTLN